MEAVESVCFIENADYESTNTSKSLLMALENVNEDCLWLNGDVIFDHDVVSRVKNNVGNTIAVNTSKCQEEEIKYTTDSTGFINAISKSVQNAGVESVGLAPITNFTFFLVIMGLRILSLNSNELKSL